MREVLHIANYARQKCYSFYEYNGDYRTIISLCKRAHKQGMSMDEIWDIARSHTNAQELMIDLEALGGD